MKLYSFVTSKNKGIADFLLGSQDGLSRSVHSGMYLAVIPNKRGGFDMHVVNYRSQIRLRSIAFGKYPIRSKMEISWH
jgi:hypothetical protein